MSVCPLRVLLFSDTHYTTMESAEELKRRYPAAHASAAAGDAFGRTQTEKVQTALEDILTEHVKQPLDLVLFLGDMSVDDYDFRCLPENYCVRFRDEVMKKLPCPAYVLAGNHDSYPDELWRGMFGYGRQYAFEQNGVLFVMLDTFRDCPAAGASGSPYTPVDTAYLKEVLAAHPDVPAFLCAHHFAPERESEEFRSIVREEPRVVALFRGHTHHNAVIPLDASWGNKLLIDIGGYGYNGQVIDGKYDFSVFDTAWAWGYELLEIVPAAARLRHVKPARRYVGRNGVFLQPEVINGVAELALPALQTHAHCN